MEELLEEDLVRLAKRENNKIRNYLYVNPSQAKHIPADSDKTAKMCKALANRIFEKTEGKKLFVIGFAETATGISANVCRFLPNVFYYQNTTREYEEGREYLYFTEDHSHAKEQKLDVSDIKEALNNVDYILFIDDEITTGNTIVNLIKKLRPLIEKNNPEIGMASVLSSMSSDREDELQRMGINIFYLKKIDFGENIEKIDDLSFNKDCLYNIQSDSLFEYKYEIIEEKSSIRKTCVLNEYLDSMNHFAQKVIECAADGKYKRVLVTGTEEFMDATICIAQKLSEKGAADYIRVHSTTRSPILVSDAPGYPLQKRYELRSVYDKERTTYIYNVDTYDLVIVVSDADLEKNPGLCDLINVLRINNNNNIKVFEWKEQTT